MQASDDELIQRAIRGDAKATTRLLESHGPRLRRRLQSRMHQRYRSAMDADDVLQVTYLEVFVQIARFEPEHSGSFEAWLNRIAENNLRDAIKGLNRAKRPPRDKQIAPAGDDSYVSLIEMLGTATTPSNYAGRKEVKSLLDKAISRLPEDYATAVRMMDLEGRLGPEVATAMGRSRGAVHMLRARAHDRLKGMLGTESNFFTRGA